MSRLEALITEIAVQPEPPDVAAALHAMGYTTPPNLVDSFKAIAVKLGAESRSKVAMLLFDLLESPYPTGAIVNFLRYIDKTGAPDVFLSTVAGGKPVREILCSVFGTSQYMSDIVTRNPGYLYWLIEKQVWEREETKANYLQELESDVSNFQSVESKLNAVRRFQRRMLLKIGVQDLLGLKAIEETTASLSHLAEAIAEAVLTIIWQNVTTSAKNVDASGLSVLALGKLGGGELNYSSDIDLIYVCDDTDDETLSLYHDVAKRFTTALSDVTAEGYLYRVDLRLRPDGDVGPLVNPFTAMMIYYESRGRPWEFQALLKARVIAGDRSVGRHFLEAVSALIFNPTLSYSPVEAIAAMRVRIRENIPLRDRSFNIKLMEGGIRDIEFIIQMLQLIHGHNYPQLRGTNTVDSIHMAHKKELLNKIEKETLLSAYRFFRLVEHRLQMMHQLKTHSIPDSPEEVKLLAARVSKGPLGRFSYEDFLATLATHLTKIRLISDSFFADEDLPESSLFLLLPEDDELVRESLSKYKLSDTRQAASIIKSLAYGSFPHLIERNTRESLLRLLPLLLEDISRTPDPNKTLINFSRIANTTTGASTFYSMLSESTPFRSLIRDIAGISAVLTTRLCGNLEILDTLREDPHGLLEAPIARDWWRAIVESSRVDDKDRVYKRMRGAIDRRLIAAWVIDIDECTFPARISQTMTASVRELVAAAFDSLVEEQDGVVLFALGSFAIGEVRLTSDLDLLVVTKNRDLEQLTRAVQLLNRVLEDGNLLKLDFRLRGEGANAPLVQDIETYRNYFAKRMSPWERVAFAKCAHWGGDPSLANEFADALMPYLIESPSRDILQSLHDTRRKLEGLVAKEAALLETKRSKGGRYDIEYLCSLGLAVRGKHFDLFESTATRLDHLVNDGLIANEDCEAMKNALTFYDRVEYLLQLGELPLPTTPQHEEEALRHLDLSMDLLGVSPPMRAKTYLRRLKRRVRGCYEEFMKRID